MANNLTDQLITELSINRDDINRLQFGEVIIKVHNGKVSLIDITKSIKPGLTGKPEARA